MEFGGPAHGIVMDGGVKRRRGSGDRGSLCEFIGGRQVPLTFVNISKNSLKMSVDNALSFGVPDLYANKLQVTFWSSLGPVAPKTCFT